MLGWECALAARDSCSKRRLSRARQTSHGAGAQVADHFVSAYAEDHSSAVYTEGSEQVSEPRTMSLIQKAAIFGAAGAIGHAVAPQLERLGIPFRVVGRGKAKLEAAFGKMAHAEVFEADLTDQIGRAS